MEHVWIWFQDIFRPGEGVNGSLLPTYTELEAYSRVILGYPMRVHEVKGVMRLADAYLGIERRLLESRRRAQKTGSDTSPVVQKSVSMSDAAGLKALFAGKGSRPRPAAPPSKSSSQ